jgi:hypothetical protein
MKNGVFWNVTPFFIVIAVKTSNFTQTKNKQTNSVALSPRANYSGFNYSTDWILIEIIGFNASILLLIVCYLIFINFLKLPFRLSYNCATGAGRAIKSHDLQIFLSLNNENMTFSS